MENFILFLFLSKDSLLYMNFSNINPVVCLVVCAITLSCLFEGTPASHMYCSHFPMMMFLQFFLDSLVYGKSKIMRISNIFSKYLTYYQLFWYLHSSVWIASSHSCSPPLLIWKNLQLLHCLKILKFCSASAWYRLKLNTKMRLHTPHPPTTTTQKLF